MPSALPFFTSFMDKTSKPRSGTPTKDESDVVKAAAWAWYHHGSGSQAKSMREYDVTCRSSHHASTPSRYKLEAIRIANEGSVGLITPNTLHRVDASDLLDTYEIESISRKLECLLESSGGDRESVSKRFLPVRYGGDHGRKDVSAEGETIKKKKLMKGFWQRHAVVCGTRKDVVETAAYGDGRPRHEKCVVPAVRMANCRPRANHAW